jgi:hypothetical protein
MMVSDDADENKEHDQPVKSETDESKGPETAQPRIADGRGLGRSGGDRCFVHEGEVGWLKDKAR